jgi:hypothetical protein
MNRRLRRFSQIPNRELGTGIKGETGNAFEPPGMPGSVDLPTIINHQSQGTDSHKMNTDHVIASEARQSSGKCT